MKSLQTFLESEGEDSKIKSINDFDSFEGWVNYMRRNDGDGRFSQAHLDKDIAGSGAYALWNKTYTEYMKEYDEDEDGESGLGSSSDDAHENAEEEAYQAVWDKFHKDNK